MIVQNQVFKFILTKLFLCRINYTKFISIESTKEYDLEYYEKETELLIIHQNYILNTKGVDKMNQFCSNNNYDKMSVKW